MRPMPPPAINSRHLSSSSSSITRSAIVVLLSERATDYDPDAFRNHGPQSQSGRTFGPSAPGVAGTGDIGMLNRRSAGVGGTLGGMRRLCRGLRHRPALFAARTGKSLVPG